jgi:hypothetical protein
VSGQVKIEEVAAEDLPENLQKMTAPQRAAFVGEMGRKRDEIKQQIDSLSEQRQVYVAAEMKRQALDATQGLDDAIRRMVREQARTKGLSFPRDTADRSAANDTE